jgi:hypothetical protein
MLTLLDKLAPIEKPEMKLLLIAAKIILLNASMTMTNRNGDKGSPYITHRKLLKKLKKKRGGEKKCH